jgi:hypothetical protein
MYICFVRAGGCFFTNKKHNVLHGMNNIKTKSDVMSEQELSDTFYQLVGSVPANTIKTFLKVLSKMSDVFRFVDMLRFNTHETL